jgi:hypothetical protein
MINILGTIFTIFSVVLGLTMLMCTGIIYYFVILPFAFIYLVIELWRQKQ